MMEVRINFKICIGTLYIIFVYKYFLQINICLWFAFIRNTDRNTVLENVADFWLLTCYKTRSSKCITFFYVF